MKYPFLALLILISVQMFGQDTRSLGDFEGISVSGNIDLVLIQGDKNEAVIKTDEIESHKVKTNNVNGILKISVLDHMFHTDEEVDITLMYTSLSSLKASAGAEVDHKGTLKGDKLTIKVSSGAEVEIEVDARFVEASAGEGGQLELAGRTESLDAKTATGGMLEAFDLESEYTEATSNTGGQMEVVAHKSIEASANTGGQICYKGNPEKEKIKEYLAGNISKR